MGEIPARVPTSCSARQRLDAVPRPVCPSSMHPAPPLSLCLQVPPPLGIGTVKLDDGSSVKGFICEGWVAGKHPAGCCLVHVAAAVAYAKRRWSLLMHADHTSHIQSSCPMPFMQMRVRQELAT